MHTKTQLIQYFKQFPNNNLVGQFLEIIRYFFEQLSIEEDATNLLCTIHQDSNTLSIQLNNIPVILHKVRDRKHYIELLLFKNETSNLAAVLQFQPHKQLIEKELVGLARFLFTKDFLNNKKTIQLWLETAQKINSPSKKKNSNQNAHNAWVYRAAMDMFVHNDLLKEVETRDKYLSIIPKAIQELLTQSAIQQIQESKTFWFVNAQGIFNQFQSLKLPNEVYESFLKDYQKDQGRYDDFVENSSNKSYAKLANLTGQLIAHLDDKAAGKTAWNHCIDKRCVATTGIRQHLWIQQLMLYKQANNNLEVISTPLIKNALLYIENPAAHTPILSPNHQQLIANNLLDSSYQSSQFSLQLISYFNKFELVAANFSNYTYLLQQILYAPSVLDLWKYTEEDIYQNELIPDLVYDPSTKYKTASNTNFPLNQILYGPPGTGKTYESLRRAIALLENKSLAFVQQLEADTIQQRLDSYLSSGQLVFCTFHQSMSYEDFVEGIKPEITQQQVHYNVKDGILKKLAKNAIQEPEKTFVLIVDELNRGNVANIFGELISLLEEDKRLAANNALKIQLPYSKELFALPPNLYFIGTMNTADRSIEQLDLALRRRFSFLEMLPDSFLLSDNVDEINLQELHQVINNRIAVLLDKNHLIGHAYLMNIQSFEELQTVFKSQILPLLLEYFHGDIGKIGLVLGNAFVSSKQLEYKNFADFDYDGINRTWDKTIYELREFPLTKEAYRSIYS